MLYTLATTEKLFQITWKHHLLCWGFPVLIVISPLVVMLFHYVFDTPSLGGFCWAVVTSDCFYSRFHYSLLVSTSLANCLLLMRTMFTYILSPEGTAKRIFRGLLIKLVPYPLYLLLQSVTVMLVPVAHILYIRPLNGVVFGMLFWGFNPDVRKLWDLHLYDMGYRWRPWSSQWPDSLPSSSTDLQPQPENQAHVQEVEIELFSLSTSVAKDAPVAMAPQNSMASGSAPESSGVVHYSAASQEEIAPAPLKSWMISL